MSATARVSVEVDDEDPVVVEVQLPWIVVARMAGGGGALLSVHRGNAFVAGLSASRFPVGWRCGALDARTPAGRECSLPEVARRVARRALRKLP